MISKDREYRSFKIERSKDTEEKDYKVKGYASTFDTYTLWSDSDGVDYNERIEPTAFNDADMSDVIFLYNHEGMVYARKKNGTLDLTIDDRGLYTEADLSTTQEARTLFESIDAGLIDQMSFAFTVEEDALERGDGYYTRVIKRIGKVYDVSAVSIPANPNTDISTSCRAFFDGAIEEAEAERLRERAEELYREKLIARAKALKIMEV